MPNLRIVSDNAIDRATLTASTTSGAYAVSNLTDDDKSTWWRSTGATSRLTAVWPTSELIACVALPFCNLSPTATMRVRGTNEASATNLISGSESLSAANGWGGCLLHGNTNYFHGVVPYFEVSKASTATSESRSAPIAGAWSPGQACTLTIALKAGTDTAAGVGIFDPLSGAFWGPDANATCVILEGPGTISQQAGSLFNITGLSTVADTLVKITRVFTTTITSGNALAMIYPGQSYSAIVGRSVLVTRLQVEDGAVSTSYYPTTSAAATRPLGHIDSWQSYAYDSGAVLACPASAIKLRGWTPVKAASAYANGGGAYARMWIPSTSFVGMAVDIADTANLQGYIEAATLVAGPYWSPSINAEYGAGMLPVDSTINYRTDAGSLKSDGGTMSRKLSINLPTMIGADRTAAINIIRSCGKRWPILLSLFPANADLELERDHMLYGKISDISEMTITSLDRYSVPIPVEEI